MSTFARLLRLISPFRGWVASAVLFSFLTVSSGVALMATSAYLISKAAVTSDVAALAIAITSVRVFAIGRAGFRYLERLVSHRASLRILTHLRVWFFTAIEPLAPARLTQHRSGDLLARSVADVETLEHFYIRVVVPPIAAALVVALACGILGAFNWTLALVLLGFLLLTGVALPAITWWLGKQPSADIVGTRAELNAMLVDEVQGVADLLVFDRAGDHRARVLSLSSDLHRMQERMALLRGASNALAVLFASLAALTVLGLAIPLVTDGEVGGVYLAMLPLTAFASFEAVQPLSLALQHLEANRAAGQRLFEVIDAEPDVREPARPLPLPQDRSIELRDVSFRYGPDGPPAVQGVSFTLPMGGRLAIVGPSGSGKTTIVNLLLRFWDYQAGRITMGGHDLRDYPSDDVRAFLSVMPQNVHLFNATLRDNLLLANPDATSDEIAAACRQALLHDFIESLPQGYETLIGENGLRLSGGERQRLAIARAILKNAPIVVLDEPTANLDAQTERDLLQSLEPFLSGRTVLIISHRLAAIEHVDSVIELERGRVVGTRTGRQASVAGAASAPPAGGGPRA